MDDWAKRSRIPLTTVDALSGSYARSHQTSSIWRSSVGLPAGPALRLQLPVNAISLFSPERRVQWQMVFHSDIFESENLPRGRYRTTRGRPPVSWINANEQMLQEIFGVAHYRALHKASSDTEAAFTLEVGPYGC
ncbi:hypothetical protein B0H13DRAFT_2232245 [Mycena leptocephala]|nr:hypothetical protein B0H13DRAFT_2232245 [Mycena leptocephala]